MIAFNDTEFGADYFSAAKARIRVEVGLESLVGQRLAVCFTEPQDWLAFFFAARECGVSLMPIHPATPYAGARRQAELAGCHRLYYNRLDGEWLSDAELDPAGMLIQMSSGTTGEPKCIKRNWADIDAEVETYVCAFREPETMSPLIACPITHSYGLICGLLVALKRGQRPAVIDTANPKYLLRKLRETHNPYLISSPAVLHTIARLLPQGERLHAAMTSGTILPEPWFATIRAKTNHLFQQYGCSEAGCIAVNPDLRAADEMGLVLPRWSLVEAGDEQQSRSIAVKRGDVVIDTLDLGYLRGDGMLIFVSRADDLINVAGLNVYPKEVEDVIMSHDGVSDAVVFRRQDSFAGQRVAVLYSAGNDVSEDDIRKWCAQTLAPHQCPTTFVRTEIVPRQANGKISRRDIATRFDAGDFTASEAA